MKRRVLSASRDGTIFAYARKNVAHVVARNSDGEWSELGTLRLMDMDDDDFFVNTQ